MLSPSDDHMEAYLDKYAFRPDYLIKTDLQRLGLTATPAVFLVNSHGVVGSSWVGYLTKKGQQEILNALPR